MQGDKYQQGEAGTSWFILNEIVTESWWRSATVLKQHAEDAHFCRILLRKVYFCIASRPLG